MEKAVIGKEAGPQYGIRNDKKNGDRMNKAQYRFQRFILKSICLLTSCQPINTDGAQLYRTRILSGILQGMYLSMPQLERTSFALGTYEPHIVRSMKRYIKPGAVTYDVGAHIGYLTLVMSKITKSNGQVFAFEPNPNNFIALRKNIQDNKVAVVTPLQRAVSDVTGVLKFATFTYSLVGHIATSDTPNDAKCVNVQSTTLDDCVFVEGIPCPDFIKIDVEGAEDRVILGAKRLIQAAKPIIIVEVRGGTSFQTILEFLNKYGYHEEILKSDVSQGKYVIGDIIFKPN